MQVSPAHLVILLKKILAPLYIALIYTSSMQRNFTNLWDLDYVRCIDEFWALIISIHYKDPDFFRYLE